MHLTWVYQKCDKDHLTYCSWLDSKSGIWCNKSYLPLYFFKDKVKVVPPFATFFKFFFRILWESKTIIHCKLWPTEYDPKLKKRKIIKWKRTTYGRKWANSKKKVIFGFYHHANRHSYNICSLRDLITTSMSILLVTHIHNKAHKCLTEFILNLLQEKIKS